MWWIPLVSTLLGGMLTLLGGFLTQKLASSRLREQQRNDFQRATLLDLQMDLLSVYRGAIKNENYTQAWRRSTVLVVRVQDDTVRSLVREFKDAVGHKDSKAMELAFEKVNDRIGYIVRGN